MKVLILGTGCPKCEALADRVKTIAKAHHVKIELEKITDINKIIEYGVMMTPGLVINGKVKAAGKIPDEKNLIEWLHASD